MHLKMFGWMDIVIAIFLVTFVLSAGRKGVWYLARITEEWLRAKSKNSFVASGILSANEARQMLNIPIRRDWPNRIRK